MGKVYFAFTDRPISYNSKNKATYKENLAKEFIGKYQKLYTTLQEPIFSKDVDVESRIIYYNRIENEKDLPDIDNISKPIIDSFNKLIYDDDKQVIQRVCMRYDERPSDLIDSLKILEIDATNLPYEVIEKINTFNTKGDENHLVVCSFKEIDKSELMGV